MPRACLAALGRAAASMEFLPRDGAWLRRHSLPCSRATRWPMIPQDRVGPMPGKVTRGPGVRAGIVGIGPDAGQYRCRTFIGALGAPATHDIHWSDPYG